MIKQRDFDIELGTKYGSQVDLTINFIFRHFALSVFYFGPSGNDSQQLSFFSLFDKKTIQ